MTNLNRRLWIAAGAAGLLGATLPAIDAHTGNLTDEEFARLAKTPKSAADYAKIAGHLKALAKEARAEDKLYREIAAHYRKHGAPGAAKAQAMDAARGLEHLAEHHADVAEALEHLYEAYEGLAENYSG